MSVAIDANVLLYACDTDSPRHDRAVELMPQHGVGSIWTADRGYRRFPDITARDPYRPDDDR